MSQLKWFRQIPDIPAKHCLLRGVQLHDSSAMLAFLSDQEIMKFITPRAPRSEEEVRRKLTQYVQKFHQKKELPWSVIHKPSQSLIGLFRIHKIDLWHRKAELAAVFHKDYQNKGYATEIFEQILPFAFNELGLNRLVGDIFADNIASEKLLTHFGFKNEGTMRQTDFDGSQFHDTVVYSLLKSEFRA